MNASYRLRTICSKGLLLVLLNLLGGVCWNLELEGRRPGGVKFMPAGLDLSHAGSAPVRHHPQPFSTYRFLTHQPEFRPPRNCPSQGLSLRQPGSHSAGISAFQAGQKCQGIHVPRGGGPHPVSEGSWRMTITTPLRPVSCL